LIDGGAGNDIISGGPGEDLLKGGAGNDVINTGSSQIGDIADGGSGSDFIHCGECAGIATSFIGEAGNDFIQGGKNSDLKLDGGEGDDWIEGGAGTDIIDGDNGPLLNILINLPVLYGGNDVITGGTGQDIMFGDGGDDIFNLGDGPGFPDGTFGFDWANYEYNHRFDNSPTFRANVWADLSGALTNPNTARSNDVLVNIEGLSGSSGNDKLFGGLGTADIVIPASTRPYGTSGKITLTLPGVLNIAGGSVVTGNGIAPNAVVLALVGVVSGNTTTIQLSAPNTGDVLGPIQISTAPLEVPSLISGLPELVLGTPGNKKYTVLDPASTKWSGGGIILGGDGNDIVYPSSGADILHGSAYLHTCIGTSKKPVPAQFLAAADVACGSGRGFSSMTQLAPLMDAGILNPEDLQIVREILPTSTRVTGLVSDGATTTYSAINNFFVGEEISIVGLTSTSAGNLAAYGSRNEVITSVTPSSFTIASTVGVISQLNDITGGIAVGTDTLDLSGGATLTVGTPGTVAGGGISGPSSQFTFASISGALPAGASFGCTMTDSVSGAVVTLYDFERIKFTNGQVQNISTACGGSGAPSAPARPTTVAGNQNVTVNWVAPADNGTAIDYYIVELSKPGTGRNTPSTPVTGFTGSCAGQIAANLLTCTATGLTAGDQIQARVSAHNAVGMSPKSQNSTPAVTVLSGVAKTIPLLTWVPTVSKITSDAAATISPLPTSSVAGTFTYTSSSGGAVSITSNGNLTVNSVGTETITALFTPTNILNAETGTVTTRVVVTQGTGAPGTKQSPVINWVPSISKVVGDTFGFNPTANVQGVFTYTSDSSSVVTISGSTASAVGPGSAVITAHFNPADTATYLTATATLTVSVSGTPGTPPPGGSSLQIVLMPSGLTSYPSGSVVKLTTTGVNDSRVLFTTNTAGCKIIGIELTATSATTCHVFAAAGSNTASIDVTFSLAAQTPLRISNKVTTVKKSATVILTTIGGTSSGAVSYSLISPSSGCVLNADELTATGPATCQVVATKAATSMYSQVQSLPIIFTFN
jgi:Ca2+-binding RTX toxin-like protein